MASKAAHRLATERALVRDWNQAHDVGTPVRYWKGLRAGAGFEGKTRTPAQLIGGHTAVVWVSGYGACIGLTHVEANPAPWGGEESGP